MLAFNVCAQVNLHSNSRIGTTRTFLTIGCLKSRTNYLVASNQVIEVDKRGLCGS
jgi:hypothetical protein